MATRKVNQVFVTQLGILKSTVKEMNAKGYHIVATFQEQHNKSTDAYIYLVGEKEITIHMGIPA